MSNDDHFSGISLEYSRGRFGYPDVVFDFLAAKCRHHDFAWDCATGSGQAVGALAKRYRSVTATDISPELLARAPAFSNVAYRCAPAESSGLEDKSIDLVVVAQALHWFCGEPFWREVSRVCRPGSIFAFWSYVWPSADEEIDAILMSLRQRLDQYWPARSQLLHSGYDEVSPPFKAIAAPPFLISVQWRRADYLAHVRSWSAVRYFKERTHTDIASMFDDQLSVIWPDEKTVTVRWPLIFRAFTVDDKKA